MKMTIKKMNTRKTCITYIMHIILDLKQGDCITCNSVEHYLDKELHYRTYTAEISTVLKILTEMGYFTMEYGKTENSSNSVKKIYTRTNKSNDIF